MAYVLDLPFDRLTLQDVNVSRFRQPGVHSQDQHTVQELKRVTIQGKVLIVVFMVCMELWLWDWLEGGCS